jgi:hypothetical protein
MTSIHRVSVAKDTAYYAILLVMCRSIKVLRKLDPPATDEDVSAAARQFVRKVSGFHKPSKANEAVFEEAIARISEVTEQLLDKLQAKEPVR